MLTQEDLRQITEELVRIADNLPEFMQVKDLALAIQHPIDKVMPCDTGIEGKIREAGRWVRRNTDIGDSERRLNIYSEEEQKEIVKKHIGEHRFEWAAYGALKLGYFRLASYLFGKHGFSQDNQSASIAALASGDLGRAIALKAQNHCRDGVSRAMELASYGHRLTNVSGYLQMRQLLEKAQKSGYQSL